MNRADFQRLADTRLREAEALLAAGLWDGAYYLAGYAVECGLKACVLARIEREGVIFDKDGERFSEQCWTHNLSELARLAGLSAAIDAAGTANPAFGRNWRLAVGWTEAARYVLGTTEAKARELAQALTDPSDGVLPWLSARW